MGTVRLLGLGAAAIALVSVVDAAPAARTTALTSAAGTRSGTVHLVTPSSRRLASAGAYPSRNVSLAAAHNVSELANVIVFVRAGAVATPPMRVSIRQVDQEFVPHLVAITAGSAVEFPNDDLIFHNVFSLSRGNAFDLGRYPKGKSKSRIFPSEGLVKVFCHLHSQMNALVRVFPNAYFAIPDREGRFTIPNVPAGRHDVVAWHERVGDVTEPVDVTSGASASLTFSLPLAD